MAPIVSDFMGHLYNKSAVLEYLLPSDDPSMDQLKADQAKLLDGRIMNLRDVVELHFEAVGQEDLKDDGNLARTKWICPISNEELGPAVKASYIVPCGHVFADVALKQVSDSKCLQCNGSYDAENVVHILSTSKVDQERLQERRASLRERGLTHSLKKASSKKRKAATTENGTTTIISESTHGADSRRTNGIAGTEPKASIKNAGTAALTAKVLAEEDAKAKRQKANPNDNLKSLFSTTSKKPVKDGDFMTRGFYIPAGAKR